VDDERSERLRREVVRLVGEERRAHARARERRDRCT
jgi:hypothetical protein